MNIFLFLVIIAVLVLVHEFGHFIVAKLFKIRVDEFAIGFPPRLFARKRGETEYSINLLPIGGYVKIFGENPNEENTTGVDAHRSFANKNRLIQSAVLVAGVGMNLIFGWILFAGVIMVGLPIPNGYAGEQVLMDSKTTILGVLPGSPAEAAQLQNGDVIMNVSFHDHVMANPSVEEVQRFIGSHADKEIVLDVVRSGESKVVTAVPKSGVVEGKAALGVSLGQTGVLKLPFFSALKESAIITYDLFFTIVFGLYDLLHGIFVGNPNLSGIAGPVGIVGLVGSASGVGVTYLLSFVAMISINLAVINLIPFPALDGGRLLFVILETITRRRIKPVIANTLNTAGFAVLIILMIVITYHDIVNII